MSSDSENSSIDLNDINVADNIDFNSYNSDEVETPPAPSPEPYLSFVQKVYPTFQ